MTEFFLNNKKVKANKDNEAYLISNCFEELTESHHQDTSLLAH